MCSSSIRAAPPSATFVRSILLGGDQHVGDDEDDDGGGVATGGSWGRRIAGHADQTSRHTVTQP